MDIGCPVRGHRLSWCAHDAIHCAEVMASAPDDPEYETELAAASEAYTERLASETQALYERHRETIPGWKARPLYIH